MKIPTIESRASNIPMTKGITYFDIAVRSIKIFVEYVGTNISIQVPLLVINRRGVSVNNQYAHIGSYIFYEDLYRSNRITTYVVPFAIGMLLARDSIVGISIPSSISLPASLFTRSVIH